MHGVGATDLAVSLQPSADYEQAALFHQNPLAALPVPSNTNLVFNMER